MEQLLILSRGNEFWSPKEKDLQVIWWKLSYTHIWGRPIKGREVQKAGKKTTMNPWSHPPWRTAAMLSVVVTYVTLLQSTLLLSLLTPALDGLLSTPLLPSRLFGTELGDTSEPGRMNGKRDNSVTDIMQVCEKITVILDSYFLCHLVINQFHSFRF